MMKKILSTLAVALAVGFAAPSVNAAPANSGSFMIAKTSDKTTMSKTGDKKLDKVLKNSKNTKRGKLDINTASAKELDALPGIGKGLAKKIIAGRPYKGKDELVKRKILTAAQYSAIRDNIIAAQKK